MYEGQRHWPGRYVLSRLNAYGERRYWCGGFDSAGAPRATHNAQVAHIFVSARHAYTAAGAQGSKFNDWQVKRLANECSGTVDGITLAELFRP